MMGWDVFSDWAYEGGAWGLYGGMSWALQMGAERARLAGDVAAYGAMLAAAKSLPLYEERMAWPAVLQRFAHYTHYGDWIGNPIPGGYWDRISPKAALAGRTGDVPMLHVGGWYDKMLDGTLGACQAMAASPVPQRLVVGPWGHIPWGRRTGIADFGPEASSPIDAEQLRWFDRFLKDQDNGVERERRCDCSMSAPRRGVTWRAGPTRSRKPGICRVAGSRPHAAKTARSIAHRRRKQAATRWCMIRGGRCRRLAAMTVSHRARRIVAPSTVAPTSRAIPP